GGDRRRPAAGRGVGTVVPGSRTRPAEVPCRADRLRGLLPGRDRDGLRVPQGGTGGARPERAAQVPAAGGVGHALPLGARRPRRTGSDRGSRARRRRVAHGRTAEALRRLRPPPPRRPAL
ncbi:MAG: YjbR family protein, partial [uncultured Blastococcus sp.]